MSPVSHPKFDIQNFSSLLLGGWFGSFLWILSGKTLGSSFEESRDFFFHTLQIADPEPEPVEIENAIVVAKAYLYV